MGDVSGTDISSAENSTNTENTIVKVDLQSSDAPPYMIRIQMDPSNIPVATMESSGPRQFLYSQVENTFNESYNPKTSNNSTICDIIAVYIKGQKILYTEAKTHCEQRLTFLMLPAIFITVLCSVLGAGMSSYSYGSTITSSLNGLNAFILALISYLKLDTRAEAHRTSAYKFDKLQSYVEFTSGKVLFVNKAANDIVKVIEDIEKKVQEIKETNQFVLPEKIRHNYPKLCGINVFAEVKKIQNKDTLNTNILKDMYNQRETIQHRIKNGKGTVNDESNLQIVIENIKAQTNMIIAAKDEYLKIDNDFEEEMKVNRESMHGWFQCLGCLKV
uniref:Uncharacterized protein n=1 Tax=viral metagenome TaxID=1070528 RepID=A0A6C0APU5_9ZZZZ